MFTVTRPRVAASGKWRSGGIEARVAGEESAAEIGQQMRCAGGVVHTTAGVGGCRRECAEERIRREADGSRVA